MRLLILSIALFLLGSCLKETTAGQNNRVVKESSLTIDDVLFDQSAEMLGSAWLLRSGQAFLSDAAQVNLKKFMEKSSSLRKQMMSICGIAPTLGDADKIAIDKIKNDQNMENGDKKSKIKDLLNARMQESSKAISLCRSEKKAELKPYIDLRNELKSDCLIKFKPYEEIAGLPTKKARAWQQVKTLTNEEKAELNKKLEAHTCTEALAMK